MKGALIALPLAFAGMASPAWAQVNKSEYKDCPSAADGETLEFCTISVVGNLPTSIGERTEDVDEVPLTAARLESALQQVPSLQQFRRSDARSANPTSQGITLRGLGGNASSRALLFLDDVPQADPFGGWVSWPGYDALNLASARVRKGGGQASAGPGALAGVIELDSYSIVMPPLWRWPMAAETASKAKQTTRQDSEVDRSRLRLAMLAEMASSRSLPVNVGRSIGGRLTNRRAFHCAV